MERHYKAFISYRHLPLQMEVATRLHKFIEHYNIPKDLRKDGEKHPGLVFRDQDELPLSGNLSDSIQQALDNSEFLIVICTPETEQSQWVLREISYFIQTHGRDHVLAVLAEGNETTSFPKLLTEDYGEDGDLLKHVEPLAANIAAPTAAKRARLLKTEGLRLIAALIGCNYDDLFKREQRYKRRRTAVISTAAILAAAIYASTVTVKNRQITAQNEQITEQNVQIVEQNSQIREQNTRILEQNEEIEAQLRQSQLNESKSLTQISRTALEDGDRYSAVKNAYDALPTADPDRPYYIPAERQLVSALGLYKTENFAYVQSLEQDTDIYAFRLSPDGEMLMTLDTIGTLRMYDSRAGRLLWQEDIPELTSSSKLGGFGYSADSCQLMIQIRSNFSGPSCRMVYDVSTGERLREEPDVTIGDNMLNHDLSDRYMVIRYDIEKGESFELRNFTDDSVIASMEFSLFEAPSVKTWAVSGSERYFAVLGTKYSSEEKQTRYEILIKDLANGSLETVPVDIPDDVVGAYALSFCGESLAVAYSGGTSEMTGDTSAVVVFAREDGGWKEQGRSEFSSGALHSRNGIIMMSGNLLYFGPTNSGDAFYYCAKSYACTVDAASGQIIGEKAIGSDVMRAVPMNDGKLLALVTYDGLLTYYMPDGYLSSDMNLYSFDTEQKIFGAEMNRAKPKEAAYAFIFRNDKKRVSLVRFNKETEHDALYQAESDAMDFRRYYFSEDQSVMVGLNCNSSQSLLYGICMDTGNPENIAKFSLTLENYSFSSMDEGDIYVTNDRLLYLNGLVIDLEAGELSQPFGSHADLSGDIDPSDFCKAARSGDGERFAACGLDLEKQCLVILHELNGTAEEQQLPEEAREDLRCEAAAPDGSAIVSSYTQDDGLKGLWIWSAAGKHWSAVDPEGILCTKKAEQECFALSEGGDTAAVLTESGEIRLLSTANGSILRTVSYPRQTASVSRLLFAENDSILLVFDYYSLLSIYRTEDGELLNTADVSDVSLNYQVGSRIDLKETADGKCLTVIFDSATYTTGSCLVLDKAGWETVGHYLGANAYLAKENVLIMAPDNSKVLSKIPLYSSAEVLEAAKAYLDAHD